MLLFVAVGIGGSLRRSMPSAVVPEKKRQRRGGSNEGGRRGTVGIGREDDKISDPDESKVKVRALTCT